MNQIIDAAFSHTRAVISALILILVAGTIAYLEIPKEADPDINIPIIYVQMSHEGISPEDAERLLIRSMELELRGIEGVKEMRSKGYEGGASVTLEFEAGFNADVAIDDVRSQMVAMQVPAAGICPPAKFLDRQLPVEAHGLLWCEPQLSSHDILQDGLVKRIGIGSDWRNQGHRSMVAAWWSKWPTCFRRCGRWVLGGFTSCRFEVRVHGPGGRGG